MVMCTFKRRMVVRTTVKYEISTRHSEGVATDIFYAFNFIFEKFTLDIDLTNGEKYP